MAKTNFTKVEEMLDDGLRQIKVKHLLHETMMQPQVKERLKTLQALENDFKYVHHLGQNPYTKFGIKKSALHHYLEHPDLISGEEWEKILEIEKSLKEFKKEHKPTEEKNADLIEQQRRKSKTKRFNINDKWIPLK